MSVSKSIGLERQCFTNWPAQPCMQGSCIAPSKPQLWQPHNEIRYTCGAMVEEHQRTMSWQQRMFKCPPTCEEVNAFQRTVSLSAIVQLHQEMAKENIYLFIPNLIGIAKKSSSFCCSTDNYFASSYRIPPDMSDLYSLLPLVHSPSGCCVPLHCEPICSG